MSFFPPHPVEVCLLHHPVQKSSVVFPVFFGVGYDDKDHIISCCVYFLYDSIINTIKLYH